MSEKAAREKREEGRRCPSEPKVRVACDASVAFAADANDGGRRASVSSLH